MGVDGEIGANRLPAYDQETKLKIKPMLGTLLIASLFAATTSVAAESPSVYPTQAVRIIIPYSPGGVTDIVARGLAESLSKKWNKSVIVENKPGGSEGIAAATVASSKPDGHTLLLASDAAYSINGLTRKDLPYNPADLLPVSRVAEGAGILVVNPALGITTVKELLDLANKKPNEVSFGSEAIGSPSEFRMRILGDAAGGYKFNHIPYKGSAPVLVDILGGRLDSAWLPPHLVKANLASKAIVPIGITGANRNEMFPDIPTLKEQGYEGVDVVAFKMMVTAPKGTPDAVVNQIAGDIAAVVKDPAFEQKYVRANGYTAIADTPAEFQTYLDNSRRIFGELVKKSGLEPK